MFSVSNIKPPKGFFRSNRLRLISKLRQQTSCPQNSYILLQGNKEEYIYDDGKEISNLKFF